MSVWQPMDYRNMSDICRRDDVETFRAPTGKHWYRARSPEEAAELRMLNREHHPTDDRLNMASQIYPTGPGEIYG